MNATEQNLTEALAIMGIRHAPSGISGKRDWFDAGDEYLGTFDAHEGWERLCIMSQIDAVGRGA